MRVRLLAVAAAIWTAANAGFYLVVIHAQGGSPAWWYLAVLGVAAASFALAAAEVWPTPMLITGVVVLIACAVAGILSIGVLLVPGIVAAVAALASRPHLPRPRASRPAG
jgi:hypothetical protein